MQRTNTITDLQEEINQNQKEVVEINSKNRNHIPKPGFSGKGKKFKKFGIKGVDVEQEHQSILDFAKSCQCYATT